MQQKRIEWIDCAKLVAIVAVAVDHCNGFLYTKPLVAAASYYSVSLFVLLAGISLWIAYESGREVSFTSQFQKVKKILIAYAIATFIGTCFIHRRFDFKTYLGYLLNFNIQGAYYYLVFFVQLQIIAPILVNWCSFVNRSKYKVIIHLGTIGLLGWISYISIKYTYILPVHGVGQFLGGGTYIILYYLGMTLMSNGMFSKNKKKRLLIMVLSLGLSGIWVLQLAEGRLPFDTWMSPYWGGGFNPPSVNFMVYSLLVLFLCYSVFSLLSEYSRSAILHKLISLICFLGKNTLYIWLYHLYVISFLANQFPDFKKRNICIRLLALGTIVMFPVIVKQLVVWFFKLYSKYVYQANKK